MLIKFTSLLLILFLTTSLHSVKPIIAEETNETKWILENVIVGEGGEDIAPNGTRREGSFRKSTVSQGTIMFQSRWLDYNRKYDYTDVTFAYTLPSFPEELQPGEKVELSVNGIAFGYMKNQYFSMTLEFKGNNVALSGLVDGVEVQGSFGPYLILDIDHQVLVEDNWETVVTEIPASGELVISFEAPSCNLDNEFSIGVFLWNGLYASVDWVYRCVQVEPEYGVIERDGNLYLVSPPNGVLEISLEDLPEWAQPWMVTVGAMCSCVGPPSEVVTGDTRVLLEGRAVARVNDKTSHGGVIVDGSDRIFVNGVPAAYFGGMQVCPEYVFPVPHVGGPITFSPTTHMWSERRIEQFKEEELADLPIALLKDEVTRGSTVLETVGKEIEVGDAIIIGETPEKVEAAIVIDKGSLVIDRPLKYDHPAGTLITRIPKEYAESVPPPVDEDPDVDEVIERKGIPGFPLWSILAALGIYFLIKETAKLR
jgi:uncharacterized Zn-binding protein involved in type VI secretion